MLKSVSSVILLEMSDCMKFSGKMLSKISDGNSKMEKIVLNNLASKAYSKACQLACYYSSMSYWLVSCEADSPDHFFFLGVAGALASYAA